MTDTTRRAVIFGAGGAGLAVALTACGGTGSDGPGTTPADGKGGSGSTGAGAGGAIAQTADIPVGGGKILDAQKIVIVQPAAGDFKAFSAICTHQGCTVGSVSNGTINCPCHGSKFSAKDGSVTNGPATEPLAQQKITVSGTSISLG